MNILCYTEFQSKQVLRRYVKAHGLSYDYELKGAGQLFDYAFSYSKEGDRVLFAGVEAFDQKENQMPRAKMYRLLLKKGVEIFFVNCPTLCSRYILDTFPNISDDTLELIFTINEENLKGMSNERSERIKTSERVKENGIKKGTRHKYSKELEEDLLAFLEKRSDRTLKEIAAKNGISTVTASTYAKELARRKELDYQLAVQAVREKRTRRYY